jgi:transporter family protein
MISLQSWQFFSILSALFAAMTAIFGKIGVSEVNSNLATFIRIIVILVFTSVMVILRGEFRDLSLLTSRGVMFLVLSGFATGASWLCYYHALKIGNASQVAPVDKLSVVLVILFAFLFLGETPTLKVILGALLILSGSLVIIL